MQLIEINKARYRRHLNRVIVACIICLTLGSLGSAQFLIMLFPDESGSHFHWNLLGVLLTSVVIGYLLNKFRHHAFMTEVVYVWELKQSLNKINRKLPKLKLAAAQGNVGAMLALQYSYAGSRLLWTLDDNTIVMEELAIEQAKLDSLAKQFDLTLDVTQYQEEMLTTFEQNGH
jgi:hypothetical protein